VTKKYGGRYGARESREIRHHVVARRDESLIHDMGPRYHDPARECHGQEEGHHRKQSDRLTDHHLRVPM